MKRNFIFVLLSVVLSFSLRGNASGSVPRDTVNISTMTDTLIDPSLPPVEIKIGTYHNFYGSTTVGYSLVLRGVELEIEGAVLCKRTPETGRQERYATISPFNLHLGDSTDRHRMDSVYIKNKFPFTHAFYEDDSLVVLTDRGNITLYLDEDRRSAAKYSPIIHKIENQLVESEEHLDKTQRRLSIFIVLLIFLPCLFALAGLAVFLYVKRKQALRTEEISGLLTILSERETGYRELQADVTELFKKNFETINALCYEYFEKGDTPLLRKSIYLEVEKEIMKLKNPVYVKNLEDALNRYCDNVIDKVSAQLPFLTDKERTLLVYLYSGLSARSICILTDIQIKNFYMRRQRLKAKILASDAPDKDIFVAMM